MADESPNFQLMMSKNLSAATAFAMANAKFGTEYARVLAAARGDLSGFTDENRTLLTLYAEMSTSIDDMSQSMAESLKTPINGVLTIIKLFGDLSNTMNKLGGGELGKALAPIAASAGMFMVAHGAIKLGQKFVGKDEKGGLLGSLTGGRGTTPTTPMYVQVVGNMAGGTVPVMGSRPMDPRVYPPVQVIGGDRMSRAGRAIAGTAKGAWKGMKSIGVGGAVMAGSGALMVGANAAGRYESTRQREEYGFGDFASSAGTGAIAGAMVGSVVPVIGTAIGALAGAIIGLTSSVVAHGAAIAENREEMVTNARSELNKLQDKGRYRSRLEETIDWTNHMRDPEGNLVGTLRVKREAEADFLKQEVAKHRKNIKDREKNLPEQYRSLSEQGAKYDEMSWVTSPFEKNALGEAIERQEKGIQNSLKEIKKSKEFLITEGQRALTLTMQNYEVEQRRQGMMAGQVGVMERGMTLGKGPSSLAQIKKVMMADVASKETALSDLQEGIITSLGIGGAETDKIFGGKSGEDQLAILRKLGSSTQKEFVAFAKEMGITEESAIGLEAVYENLPDYAEKLTKLEQDRARYLDDVIKARTVEIDVTQRLLEIEQSRIGTAHKIATALHLPSVVNAELTAQQVKATEMQISLEERRLEVMKQEGRSIIEQREQVAKIDGLYGQLADQVDYIRRSWEEVFTQQSLNLPGGSHILPTMTGMMEKGPAFLPFAQNQMNKDGGVRGHGTYEKFMGYGKASAFGKLQEHLANVMSGVVDKIDYASNNLASSLSGLAEKVDDIAGGGSARAGN
jgi:hypothetical protein